MYIAGLAGKSERKFRSNRKKLPSKRLRMRQTHHSTRDPRNSETLFVALSASFVGVRSSRGQGIEALVARA